MYEKLKSLTKNGFAIAWIVVFAAFMIAAPERGPAEGIAGRLFMAFWCASGLTLAALHLLKPSAARVVLDALFTLQNSLTLFGRERDAYAMSDVAVRAVGVGMLAITSLGLYDIFLR